MRRKYLVIFTIGILLSLSFALPVLSTAYSDLDKATAAEQTEEYGTASRFYERAARVLFWRRDVREMAGISAYSAELYSNAVQNLEQASELSEMGWAALGYSYLALGDPRTQETFQSGLEEYPDSAALFAGLADLHRSRKDWEAERTARQNQIRFDPENLHAHYRLGLLLTLLEPEPAIEELTLASSQDPEFKPAVRTLRAALDISRTQTDPSRRKVTIGRALGLVGEWELSLAAFESAVGLNDQNAEAWAWLGEAKQQTGRDGRVELDRALSIDYTSAVVRALRGLYWSRQGKSPQMLAEYLLAAEYEPENPAWQASLGDAYIKTGDLAAALQAYQRATVLEPDESVYWRLLAVFCAENGVHVEEVGLPAAKKAVELAPSDPQAIDALGFSYFSSGRFASAQETLSSAIEISPRYFPAHIHLAMNFLAQGDRPSAFNSLTYVRDADAAGGSGQLARELLDRYFP